MVYNLTNLTEENDKMVKQFKLDHNIGTKSEAINILLDILYRSEINLTENIEEKDGSN